VTVTEGRTIRRTCRLQVVGTPDLYELLSTDGTVLAIEHGLRFGNTTELVPVFTGEVIRGGRGFGDSLVEVAGHDFGHWLTEARFLTPYSPTGSPTRAAAISGLVTGGKPGTTVHVTTASTGNITAGLWDRLRVDAIDDIARDGNLDAFFLPDGSYMVRDSKTITTLADYTVRGGRGGTLTDGERVRPLDRRYNTVVVSPASTGQVWTAQTAQVSDTANPRHPDRIGVRPYFMSLPTVTSAAQALDVAQVALDRIVGTSESIAFGAVSNPALDCGDVVRVVIPGLNGEPDEIVQHFLTALSLDLATGSMTADTRAQRVTNV